MEPLLAAHDTARVTVTCYQTSAHADAVTERLAKLVTLRSIVSQTDSQAAEMIRADGIDVLVDLAGHTVGHRLGVFAHAPAPLQVAYLGYPGTTGVPAIRYRITDEWVDPEPSADAYYSERLYRLQRVFCCFMPPSEACEVAPLPALANGFVTFGSLNKYLKVTDDVLRTWARILQSVPDSRLVLQNRTFAEAASCELVRQRFAAYGVAPDRLELYGMLPLAEHLRMYNRIDIGLDTYPWNGHTTTCLALHMGVAVLALAGDAGAARMGLSVLRAAGLQDWVAADEDSYVASAQAWASALSDLAALRGGLRAQLARSALCEARSLAQSLEDAYASLLQLV
jgi:predicted O-linked N-acetylglucosamine transferase (SPINDLY family)